MSTASSHLQKIIKLHFNEEHGAPYWIEKKKELSFDPEEEIETLEDLHLFIEDENYQGFPSDKLKEEPKDLIPKKLDKSEYELYSSGGRTGKPKWTAWKEKGGWERVMEIVENQFEDQDIKLDRDIAYIGPTGPHPFGYAPKKLANRNNVDFLTIDLDPRWVRKTKTDPELRKSKAGEEYINHLKSQTQTLLKQFGPEIGILISTPTIIQMLHQSGALDKLRLDGIVWAGQAMKPENYQALKDELDCPIVGWYGNTLLGISPHVDFEDGNIVYQPDPRLVQYQIVDDNLEEKDYGERGRTLTHILREGLFAPYHMEDDAGTRLEPREDSEVDAVGNPDVPEDRQDDIESGVY
jgi:hypothetical protein